MTTKKMVRKTGSVRRPKTSSRAGKYIQLPKTLKELGSGYRALIRELAKR